MNASPTPRPGTGSPSAARLTFLAVLAAASFGLAGCGDDPGSEPTTEAAKARAARAATAEAMAILTTHPMLDVFVAFQPPARGGIPRPRRTEAEALVRARELVARLRAPDASFDAIARDESDDLAAAADGGFVGFVSRLTGEDELLIARAATVPVGQVSDPLPGKGGFHIVRRLSREEGKAVEARVFAPYEGLLIPSVSHVRGLPATQTDEWARAEALRALAALREGTATLEKLAEPISGSRVLRDVVRGSPPAGYEVFAAAMRAAEPGSWKEPIEIPDGLVVVRRIPCVRAAVRHLVITHAGSTRSRRLTPRALEDAERLARAAKARLDKDPASWDQVVAELSEEPGTKDAGGFMGDVANTTWFPKRYPPEIENAIWKLAPGETSDVVPSRFGLHIFRRID